MACLSQGCRERLCLNSRGALRALASVGSFTQQPVFKTQRDSFVQLAKQTSEGSWQSCPDKTPSPRLRSLGEHLHCSPRVATHVPACLHDSSTEMELRTVQGARTEPTVQWLLVRPHSHHPPRQSEAQLPAAITSPPQPWQPLTYFLSLWLSVF